MTLSKKELHDFVQKCIDEKIEIQKPDTNTYILKIGKTTIDGISYEGFKYKIGQNSGKYVTFDFLYTAYKKLTTDKIITREWFQTDTKFKNEAKGRPCNFTTVGGIFVELKIAKYNGDGDYTYIER